MTQHDLQVVQHLLTHCRNIKEDVDFIETKENLCLDARTQRSMICSILQVGELVNEQLSEEFKREHSSMPWRAIVSMRHKLVHHYEDAKLDAIWATAVDSIPSLSNFLQMQISSDIVELKREVSRMNLEDDT